MSREVVTACVTGATGYIGAHVAKLASERCGPPLSLAAAGLRVADRAGLLGGLRLAERWTGRRLVAP